MNHMKQSGIVGLGGIWSVTAFVANVVVSLALIAVLPIMVIWPFGEVHHPSVEVHDEAGVLQSEPLAKEIQAMGFRQDVHVAVLTVPGWDVDNLNDSVLEYARSHQGDTDVPWISTSNPNYWSDGLVILAVAPEARKVGCYFGEDVAVPLEQQAAIQNAAKNQYRRADWYGGTLSMAAKTADVIGRPGGGDVGTTYVLPGISALVGLVWLSWYLWRGFAARRRAREKMLTKPCAHSSTQPPTMIALSWSPARSVSRAARGRRAPASRYPTARQVAGTPSVTTQRHGTARQARRRVRCCQCFVGVILPVQGEVSDGLSIDFDSHGVRIMSVCGFGHQGAPRGDCAAAAVSLRSEGVVRADDPANGRFVLVHNVQTDAPIVDEGRVVNPYADGKGVPEGLIQR